jgi:LacI family transcriptional regulator
MCLSQETKTYAHFDPLLTAGTPLVFFDRVCRPAEVPTVVVDNQAAACHITRHCAAQGRRRIAHITGPPALNISQERVAGYHEGLAAEGLPFNPQLLVPSDLSVESATAAAQQLLALPEPPDAIFTINDTTAFAAMKEIKRQGLRIPADVALVGFTDEYHATVVEPALTSVMHPTFEIGRTAALLFLEQTQGPVPPRQVVLATQLVVRESSGQRG